MGNNASSSSTRPTPSPSSGPPSGTASPRPTRRDRDGKHPHPGQRTAAAPAPGVAPIHAQGSTSNPISTVSSSLQSQLGLNPSNSTASAVTYPNPPPSNSANSSIIPLRPADTPKARAVPTDIPSGPQSPSRTGEPTKPVAVPHSQPAPQTTREPLSPYADSVDTSTMMMSRGSMQDMSYITRPPRMPLPIEEEIHTPGSPIVAPAEGESIEELSGLDTEGSTDGLVRKTSVLSTTTVDEDEADAAELLVDKTRPTVPTRLEWLRGGEKIYVTGTIFQWSRKHRLLPVEGRPGVFAATIPILPGTHHIRFLVDNQMQTSHDLPTTVDFGNNLVNYIEVNPADARSLADAAAKRHAQPKEDAQKDEDAQARRFKQTAPDTAFTSTVPGFLLDFDQNEDTKEYNSSAVALDRLQNPPSLPGFLGKPILNAATLIKDDNSVLNMPNHTVLNHLATSSIKNATLAVSATTRYKSKYVTTIIYKPTEHHD